MRNVSKTYIIVLVSMVMVISSVGHSYAATPFVSELENGSADFYLHYSSLNKLHLDGDNTDNFDKVKKEFRQAMDRFNDLPNADLDLDTTGTFSTGDYVVYGKDLGLFGYSGQATYPHNTDEQYVRFNTLRHFGTSGGCGWFHVYNIEWLSNHELGHVVGLGHPPQSDPSMMVHECKTTWSNIQEQDELVLNHYY